MNDVTLGLWRLAQAMHDEGIHPDLLSLLKRAKAQAISFDLDQVCAFLKRERRSTTFICPDFVTAFIASYLQDAPPKTILDPAAGIGTMLAPLIQRFEPTVAIGCSPDEAEIEVARLLYDNISINWRLSDLALPLNDIETRFDVVVSCPPLKGQPNYLTLKLGDSSVQIHDEPGRLLLLKASMALEPGGVGFFVVTSRFTKQRSDRSVYTNLARFGLFVDAVLALPSRTLSPATHAAGSLIIIRREKSSQLFVGELTSDPSYSNALLGNLKARKEGKAMQLGVLIEPESFRSFHTLVAEREIKTLSRSLGLPPTPLSEIATTINFAAPRQEEEFADLPNVVYLPLLGQHPAVASLAELQMPQSYYAQIVLDPNKAIANYVSNFFNTSLGQKIRESLSVGGSVREIRRPEVCEAIIYLPDRDKQTEIIGIQSNIPDILTQIETYQRQLWNHPRKANEIQRAIKTLNHEDNFESWMETLPFPIASILWAYHADTNVEHKVDHLFHFFEALSEFTAAMMLSAYAADKAFYAQESGAWIDNDPRFRDWAVTSTFGGWQILGERLAKVTRKFQEDKDIRERCLELFGSPNAEFMSMLTDKSLFAVLREVVGYRNSWRGHGGVVSSQESYNRLTLLESNLAKVRKVLLDRWDTALLLSPGSSDYSEGVFYYQARTLVGTRNPFRKVAVETTTPMDRRKLYLLHVNQKQPVELLPFFRLMESPRTQQNACYFYNRMLGNQVRWVSYHFDSDAEVICFDDEVHSALSLLRPAENDIGELNL